MPLPLRADLRTSTPILGGMAGAAIISFGAVFYELSGTSPLTGTVFRMGYAFPVLLLMGFAVSDRDIRPRRDRIYAFAAGVFFGIDIALWQTSIKLIGTGLATLIANSQVIIVPVTVWILLSEKPGQRVIAAMPIVTIGLALLTGLGSTSAFGSRPVLGVLLATCAALFYSGFLIFWRRSNRLLVPAVSPLRDAVAGALTVALLIAVITGDVDLAWSWPAHGWLIALGVGPQVFGWLLIGFAIPRLPTALTSFIILLQPTMTFIWGRILFDERPSMVQFVGVGLVIVGIAIALTTTTTARQA